MHLTMTLPQLPKRRRGATRTRADGLPALPTRPNATPKYDGPTPHWRHDEAGNVIGTCGRCGDDRPAMQLILDPEHNHFGDVIPDRWLCTECKPRSAGKPNGGPTQGWCGD